MKLHPFQAIRQFSQKSIYIGPLLFISGIIVALSGELTHHPSANLTGLTTTAAGLIIWGCHGIRRRGKRPGFVLMSFFGSAYFLLHLYYRYSDYRWAKINSIFFENSSSVTANHLESRVVLFSSVLLISAIIGMLPPLPKSNRPAKKPLVKED